MTRSCRLPADDPPRTDRNASRSYPLVGTILHAVILASLVIVGAWPAHAAVGPNGSAQDRSAAFVADGDAAFERGDYEEAITKYRAAYYGLTAKQRTSYVGSIPVRNAMRAYALLLAERQDRVLGDWKPLPAERLPRPSDPPPIEPAHGCQRASIASNEPPSPVLLLGLLGLLASRQRRESA